MEGVMAEEVKAVSSEEPRFEVKPTSAVEESNTYTDIALTNLAREHAAQVSSQRQVVWQVYSVMLIANSLVFGFMTTPGRSLPEVSFGVALGVSLSIIWLILTRISFDAFLERVKAAYKFSWP